MTDDWREIPLGVYDDEDDPAGAEPWTYTLGHLVDEMRALGSGPQWAQSLIRDKSNDRAPVGVEWDAVIESIVHALERRSRWIYPGDFIRLRSSHSDWWEYVLNFGPDGRMVTVDRNNKVRRYSDPTEDWLITDNRPASHRRPRQFSADQEPPQ